MVHPKVQISNNKQTIYWAQWLIQGIRIINDLFKEGHFVSYNRLREHFNLVHIWKYLLIIYNVLKGKFTSIKKQTQ